MTGRLGGGLPALRRRGPEGRAERQRQEREREPWPGPAPGRQATAEPAGHRVAFRVSGLTIM